MFYNGWAYREQAPKPQPPQLVWWNRLWAKYGFGAVILLAALAFMFVCAEAIDEDTAKLDKAEAARIAASPCVDAATESGYVEKTLQDGTRVLVARKWCVAWKPGREGQAP